jgi:hypothetical protein
MEHRRKRIQVETDRHRITGTVTLPSDAHHGRLSDVLNSRERDFLALTDVTIESLDGGPPESQRFTAVSRQKIVLVSELD